MRPCCHPVFTVRTTAVASRYHQGRLGVAMTHEPPIINMHVSIPFLVKKRRRNHTRGSKTLTKKKARGRVSICMRFGALFHHHKEMYACIARPAAHSLRSGFGGARYALGIIVPYRPVSAFSVGWGRSPRCRLVQLASRRIRSMVVSWWCSVAELEYSMDPLMQPSSSNLPLHASTRPRGRQHLPVRHAPARSSSDTHGHGAG